MATLTALNAASPLDASDDSRLLFTNDTDETLSRALDDVDADFLRMDALLWLVEYRLVGGLGVDPDTYELAIRIVNGATILAAADAAGTFTVVDSAVTNSADETVGPSAFAYVNTNATAADWNGASVELRQDWTISILADSAHIEVDFVEFTGEYTTDAAALEFALGSNRYMLVWKPPRKRESDIPPEIRRQMQRNPQMAHLILRKWLNDTKQSK